MHIVAVHVAHAHSRKHRSLDAVGARVDDGRQEARQRGNVLIDAQLVVGGDGSRRLHVAGRRRRAARHEHVVDCTRRARVGECGVEHVEVGDIAEVRGRGTEERKATVACLERDSVERRVGGDAQVEVVVDGAVVAVLLAHNERVLGDEVLDALAQVAEVCDFVPLYEDAVRVLRRKFGKERGRGVVELAR